MIARGRPRRRSSPACASGDMWAGGAATKASSRGATPASRFAARRWPTSSSAFADVWAATGGRRCPTTRCRARADRAGRRRGAAGRSGRKPATSPACSASISSSPPSRARRCGSPTPTSSARSPTCRRCSAAARRRRGRAAAGARAASDLPLVQPLSRAGYRALLEAGVRVFEWNGSMIHAKTAVADGRWARVGSTQPQHPELDGQLGARRGGRGRGVRRARWSRCISDDLENATEMVLERRTRARVARDGDCAPPQRASPWTQRTGRTRRAAAAGALRLGRTFGAALTARRAARRRRGRAR